MCDSDAIVMNVSDKAGALKKIIDTAGKTPVFLFWNSKTCPHCITLKKYFDAYRSQCIKDKASAIIVYIGADTAPELFSAYKIGPVPHTMVYQNGSMIKEIVGADAPALACAMRTAGIQISMKEI